jgi:CheY-like chemotaxis protein
LNPGQTDKSGLKGHLEDLPFIDMLQIVAFSKKTGYLEIEGSGGRGGVVFKDGLVVCAYSWSTIKYLKQIADDPHGNHPVEILQKQIEISLQELAGLKEGRFHFEVTATVPTRLEGKNIAPFLLQDGINPEGLLLDLARDRDERREMTSELLETGPLESEPAVEQPPHTAAPETIKMKAIELPPDKSEEQATSVLLVDDEPPVRDAVSTALRSAGYRVYTAAGTSEGIGMASELSLSSQKLVVVTDLGMPSTSGRSFRGGFELAHVLKKTDIQLPVILMTEKLSPKARTRANNMGIHKVAMKPALSKLDAEQYQEDLKAFAAVVIRLVEGLGSTPDAGGQPVPSSATGEDKISAPFLEFIASMTEQLVQPKRSNNVSQLVIEVASKYLDRGILFIIKDGKACGLGGFGFVSTEQAAVEVARKIHFDIGQARPFAEVVYCGKAKRFNAELDDLQSSLYSIIGRGRATECVLVPMLNNGEVLVILYGDNAGSGRAIGKLRGLELFMGQAGIMLENAFLHQKLRAFESKLLGHEAPAVATEVESGR